MKPVSIVDGFTDTNRLVCRRHDFKKLDVGFLIKGALHNMWLAIIILETSSEPAVIHRSHREWALDPSSSCCSDRGRLYSR